MNMKSVILFFAVTVLASSNASRVRRHGSFGGIGHGYESGLYDSGSIGHNVIGGSSGFIGGVSSIPQPSVSSYYTVNNLPAQTYAGSTEYKTTTNSLYKIQVPVTYEYTVAKPVTKTYTVVNQAPAVSYQPSVSYAPSVSYQPAVSYQPSMSYQPSVSYQQAPVSYQPSVSYQQAPVSYQPSVSYQQAPVSYQQAPVSYHQAPVSYSSYAPAYTSGSVTPCPPGYGSDITSVSYEVVPSSSYGSNYAPSVSYSSPSYSSTEHESWGHNSGSWK